MSTHERTALIALWIIAAILVCCAAYIGLVDRGYDEVSFIDVGEADSAFIKTRHHKAVLIDGGNTGSGEYTLTNYLRSSFTPRLDAVFVSHMHDDHMNGVIELINGGYPISRIYVSRSSDACDELSKPAEEHKIPIFEIQKGDIIDIDNTKFTIMSDGHSAADDDENDRSLIIRMDCGKNSFLFTGDATSNEESEILNDNIDVNFLKVGHHGSKTSSSPEFIEKVSPQLAVISVGLNNSYHHPSPQTLDTLEKQRVPILRTDYDGTVTVIMTEDDIRNICTSEHN